MVIKYAPRFKAVYSVELSPLNKKLYEIVLPELPKPEYPDEWGDEQYDKFNRYQMMEYARLAVEKNLRDFIQGTKK